MKVCVTIFAILFFQTSSLFAQIYKTIHLTTIKDSVAFLSKMYYTEKYVLDLQSDSLYVTPIITFSSDMGIHSPSHHYLFKDSIPDGCYKIVIDGKPVEKTTFLNQKKNGMNCQYYDEGLYHVRAYVDNKIVEYHKIDAKGNVLEYSPCLNQSYLPLGTDFIYLFDKKHELLGVKYAFSQGVVQLTDYYLNGKLRQTVIRNRDHGIERSGIVENQNLSGEMQVRWLGERYTFTFDKGVLKKWHYEAKKWDEDQSFDLASNHIKTTRADLLRFCLD